MRVSYFNNPYYYAESLLLDRSAAFREAWMNLLPKDRDETYNESGEIVKCIKCC